MQTRQLMRLAGVAKKLIDKRGGTDRLKQDVEELKTIARSEGTLEEKARRAAQRLRQPAPEEQPGGHAGEAPGAAGGTPATDDAGSPPGAPPPNR
ncbi:MAG: hypothetical protein QOK40_3194 [Miltoncostaeaceae bacterium]|jgi:hypothetical protein|nr:hypothetical protein [Miltoncostaeaceae bacterium]